MTASPATPRIWRIVFGITGLIVLASPIWADEEARILPVTTEVAAPPPRQEQPVVDTKGQWNKNEASAQLRKAEQAAQRDHAENSELQARLGKTEKALGEANDQASMLARDLRKAREETSRCLQQIDEHDRRLTEGAQALEAGRQAMAQLQAELQQVRSESEALRSEIGERDRRLTEGTQALEAGRQAMAQLQAELQQVRSESEALRSKVGERDQRLTEGAQALETGRQAIVQLQAELQQVRSEGEGLRQEIARLQANVAATAQQLAETRALLPLRQGGTVTPDALRDIAHASALRLEMARQELIHDPTARATYEAIVAQLAQEQLRLANAIAARGVYQVRSGDTLARVAARLYGGSDRWSEIYQANRHVLDDADRLLPDVTLVVP